VADSDFFKKVPAAFTQVENEYLLSGSEMGVPVGRHLELPVVEEGDARIGKDDAPIRLIEFSDFQCPYCKSLHESIKQVLAEMGDQVQLVYKYLPLDFHAQAQNAAMAGACATEQGRFEDYANRLFSSQSEWGDTKGTAKFKAFAVQLKLDASQFNKCMDENRYKDLINKDKDEANKFGITGTPAIFINDQFKNGAVSLEELKAIIQAELKK
jgi:protein-disulfide isomerase